MELPKRAIPKRRPAADHEGMSVALSVPRAGEMQVRQLLKDGELVAVLMGIEQGDSFTVITEVFAQGGAGSSQKRPHTFPDAHAGLAFMNETVTAFTYLGCEVRQPAA